MSGVRLSVAIIALAALTACGGGSFAAASISTCSATTSATIAPGGGTITFPTVSGASATLTYKPDSSIPATTATVLGTTTCFAGLATPQPNETLALAFTINVSQPVDLLSQITVTLPTAPSSVGYYGVRVYAEGPGALQEYGFPGSINGSTITFPPGSSAFGLIMNANQTYVIEILNSTAPTPPPP